MGLGLAISINACYSVIREAYRENSDYNISLFFIIANFLIFLSTFIRFFWGDSRYLDLHYRELITQIRLFQPGQIDDEFDRMTGKRRFFDIVLLTIHGTIFIFLGFSVDSFYFYVGYAVLMITNSLWLTYNKHLDIKKETIIEKINTQRAALGQGGTLTKQIKTINSDYAPRYWIKNNFVAFLLMAITYVISLFISGFPATLLYAIMVSICVVNCILDFWKTWDFYFPKLGELIITD